MITRQEYMESSRNGKSLHRECYAQFVTPWIKASVMSRFGERLFKSTNEHFNDIPLEEWDRMAGSGGNRGARRGVFKRFHFDTAISMKSVGDFMILSSAVCILKEAARQIVEGQTK